MRMRSSWFAAGASIAAVASIALASLAPALAASPRAQSGLGSARHAAKSTVAAKCTTKTKASGTVKYSDWQFPDTLNVYQTQASVSSETITAIKDEVYGYDGQGKPFAILLTNLPSVKNGEVKDGGKTVTATLKKGLRWSNGAEITAADVKFGFKVASDPKSGPYCLGTCDVISRIDTIGKYGLVFHLKHVFAPFVPSGFPPIWPTKWAGAWGKGDVAGAVHKLFEDSSFNFEGPSFPTNGPYQVTSFVKDDRIVLHPMKYYRTMNCGPKVATLIFAFYSSKPDLIAAAASRSTDITTDYTPADLKTLYQHAGQYKVDNKPGYLIEHLTYNLDATYNGKPNPFHNVKVRQALALALDKLTLIRSALGIPKAQAQDILAWTPLILTKRLVQPFADKNLKGQWDPIAKKYQVNTGSGQALADAKKLLQQAGFSGGFSVDAYTTSGNPVRQAQYAIVQADWQKVGVHLVPNFVPASKIFGGWNDGGTLQHGTFQLAMYADVGYPDPDGLKTDFQHQYIDREKTTHSSVNANVAGIHDPVLDKAFNNGAGTFDPKLRQKYYNQFQVQLNKQAYWVPLFYRGQPGTNDGRVGNFAVNPTNAGNQWNTWAWYVKGLK